MTANYISPGRRQVLEILPTDSWMTVDRAKELTGLERSWVWTCLSDLVYRGVAERRSVGENSRAHEYRRRKFT